MGSKRRLSVRPMIGPATATPLLSRAFPGLTHRFQERGGTSPSFHPYTHRLRLASSKPPRPSNSSVTGSGTAVISSAPGFVRFQAVITVSVLLRTFVPWQFTLKNTCSADSI